MWLIPASVLTGLCSSAVIAFSYIMQKKAYLEIAGTNRKVYKTCTWFIGFILLFIGSLLSLGKKYYKYRHSCKMYIMYN